MFICTARKKSFFLIFALWTFILLSIFCIGMGVTTFFQTRKVKLFLNRQRALTLASSGIQIAKSIIAKDDSLVDYLGDDWSGPVEEASTLSSPKKEIKLKISLIDEGRKIPLSVVNEDLLRKLFDYAEIEDSNEKINCILDYIDVDDVERGLESEDDVKNEALVVLEELLLIDAFSYKDYEVILKFCTPFFDSNKININTASREILEILIEEQNLRNDVFLVRFGENLIEGDDDDSYYGESGEALPEELKGVFSTVSNFFRIESLAEIEGVTKKITCIIDRLSGRILYWYEK